VAQKPVWTRGDYRTDAGQALVLAGNARLEALGKTRRDKKAVHSVILDLIKTEPAYKGLNFHTLKGAYNRALHKAPPPVTEEDGWMSLLIEWGKEPKRNPVSISAEQAGEMINSLTGAAGPHRRERLNQLFVHMNRRIHWNGRKKIEWLRSVIARLAANPHDWPIPITRRGRPDLMAGRIETYLANAPGKRAHKQDILTALEIRNTSGQNALVSMVRAGRLVRVADGMYSLPIDGVSNYVPGQKAIVDVLAAGGSYTNARLRALTGLTEGAIHAAVHHLVKQGKAIRIKRGLWALPGTAPPHIYARDAIIEALQSGPKTVRELMTATGKNRGEIWQALHRLKAKGLIIEVHLIRPGCRGYQAAFALPPERKHSDAPREEEPSKRMKPPSVPGGPNPSSATAPRRYTGRCTP
jgi:hypothetical protein